MAEKPQDIEMKDPGSDSPKQTFAEEPPEMKMIVVCVVVFVGIIVVAFWAQVLRN